MKGRIFSGKVLFLLATVLASGQPLRVFSEFVRFDKAGDPVAPAQPREILSPAIVRNGFTSFQVSIQGRPGVRWTLYVGQNPDDAVKITLYRPSGDHLELADLPVQGEGVQILWMDLWADRAAPVRRIKVEPQLSMGADWVIYPMEGRVMEAVVPRRGEDVVGRPLLCPRAAPREDGFPLRNLRQDAELAVRAPKDELTRLIESCPEQPPPNPEWYFSIRDYLFRLR